MKLSKILGVVAVAAMALMAFASTASATTLETKGVAVNAEETIHATLEAGTSALLADTGGFFANTCTESTMFGHTEKDSTGDYTGPTVAVQITTLTFNKCKEEPVVVDTPGTLTITHITGTTNGTVRSIGAKVTSPSPFGALTCTTAASPGTDVGTVTGVKEGSATMDINAVLNCGFFLPSAKWQGSYSITTPNLGVTA
jgi:hypothetical protein